jgi:hypothetical protein
MPFCLTENEFFYEICFAIPVQPALTAQEIGKIFDTRE